MHHICLITSTGIFVVVMIKGALKSEKEKDVITTKEQIEKDNFLSHFQ